MTSLQLWVEQHSISAWLRQSLRPVRIALNSNNMMSRYLTNLAWILILMQMKCSTWDRLVFSSLLKFNAFQNSLPRGWLLGTNRFTGMPGPLYGWREVGGAPRGSNQCLSLKLRNSNITPREGRNSYYWGLEGLPFSFLLTPDFLAHFTSHDFFQFFMTIVKNSPT